MPVNAVIPRHVRLLMRSVVNTFDTRKSKTVMALYHISKTYCEDGEGDNDEDVDALVASGIIPQLVRIMGSSHFKARAYAGIAMSLAFAVRPELVPLIIAANAIPLLVQAMMRDADSDNDIDDDKLHGQSVGSALSALGHLVMHARGTGITEVADEVVAAGALPKLVQMINITEVSTSQGGLAIIILEAVATHGHDDKVVAAGAIPELVRIMRPSAPSHVQLQAAHTLDHLAVRGFADVIVAAGAVTPLVLLLRPGVTAEDTQGQASALLLTLALAGNDHHAAIRAAGATAGVMEALEALGL